MKDNKKIIAFIPARCGSKSIKYKNIKDFCGQPLIYWNLNALENSPEIDEVYVATDCDEIEYLVINLGFKKVTVYRREAKNASDTSSTEDVMLEFINKKVLPSDTIFMLVQVTSPFTRAKDFSKAIEQFTHSSDESLLSVVRSKRFFWNENGKPVNYNYQNRPRRQDFPGILMENGAFYINTIQNINRDKNRLSEKIGFYEMPEYTSIEIDEEDDWLMAENFMRKYLLKNNIKNWKIKLLLSDVDGVLTDAGMYYSENGDELKKFSTYDGMGFNLLKKQGIKVGLLTTEDRELNRRRAKKLALDYDFHGIKDKLTLVEKLCADNNLKLSEVAYIGDDVNCKRLLEKVGVAACPLNAVKSVKQIPNIIHINKNGGEGALREFAELILEKNNE